MQPCRNIRPQSAADWFWGGLYLTLLTLVTLALVPLADGPWYLTFPALIGWFLAVYFIGQGIEACRRPDPPS